MPFTFLVLAYTGLSPVSTVKLCPLLALHYSFGTKVGGPSTGHAVGGSSAALNDGDDERVNEEVNVQAPRPKRRKSEVWWSMSRSEEW